MRGLLAGVAALLIAFASSGCYHTRIVVRGEPVTTYSKRTVHQLFWGLYQQNVTPPATDNCVSGGMQEVRVTTTFFTAAATVLTLGIWSPMIVEWRCAARPTRHSSLMAPHGR